MQFVLDCSVAISWCLVDENNPTANAILAIMPDAEAFVPGIWSLEIANVLLVALRRNRMTQEQSPTRSSKQLKDKDKLAKRENPDYTQTTFRIPKKLSRQINRVLMDLADEGEYVDRSDLLEELASAFIRLADEVGVVEALEQVKHLGTQMDE